MSSSSLAIRLASGPRKSLARQLAANPPAVLDLTRPMTPKRYKFWTEFAKTHRIEMIEKDSTRQGAKTPASPAKESVLRDLISLHHASASFMHSPEEARIGFENAFARTPEPKFEHYESWARGVIGSQGDNQLVNNDPTSFDPVTYDSGNPGEVYWQTFKKNDDLFSSSNNSTTLLTAREREVKEALFGTWERGGLGMEGSKPGLDGVMEYLKAKGETVASTAAEWESRNKIVSVSAPQEPEIPSIEAPQH